MRILIVFLAVALGACGGSENGSNPGDSGADDAGAHDAGDQDGGGGDGERDCFDGLDDDADGAIDCADSDCDDGATCVPVSGALGLEAGVTVGEAEACPAGFEGGEVVLHRDIVAGDCVGCECAADSTSCSATLWYYQSDASCTDDAGHVGGEQVDVPVDSFACTDVPIVDGSIYGIRVEMEALQTCSADGTAEADASWGESMKFCRASDVGGGCASDEVCVPRAESGSRCALAAGDVACTGYTSPGELWYTDFDDPRVCGACECTATGGNCDAVSVSIGSDWVCTDAYRVSDGEQWCASSYSPPAELVGTPVAPDACEATAQASGEIELIGPSTLCCDP